MGGWRGDVVGGQEGQAERVNLTQSAGRGLDVDLTASRPVARCSNGRQLGSRRIEAVSGARARQAQGSVAHGPRAMSYSLILTVMLHAVAMQAVQAMQAA